jgi:hypothetical protein
MSMDAIFDLVAGPSVLWFLPADFRCTTDLPSDHMHYYGHDHWTCDAAVQTDVAVEFSVSQSRSHP